MAFYIVEGVDGVGKSTFSSFLADCYNFSLIKMKKPDPDFNFFEEEIFDLIVGYDQILSQAKPIVMKINTNEYFPVIN